MKMHFFHSFHNVWKLITSQPSERQEKKTPTTKRNGYAFITSDHLEFHDRIFEHWHHLYL